jgi:hypothetical protein
LDATPGKDEAKCEIPIESINLALQNDEVCANNTSA